MTNMQLIEFKRIDLGTAINFIQKRLKIKPKYVLGHVACYSLSPYSIILIKQIIESIGGVAEVREDTAIFRKTI